MNKLFTAMGQILRKNPDDGELDSALLASVRKPDRPTRATRKSCSQQSSTLEVRIASSLRSIGQWAQRKRLFVEKSTLQCQSVTVVSGAESNEEVLGCANGGLVRCCSAVICYPTTASPNLRQCLKSVPLPTAVSPRTGPRAEGTLITDCGKHWVRVGCCSGGCCHGCC